MSINILFLCFLIIICWGIYGIFIKLSVERIGIQTLIWSTISSVFIVIIFIVLNNKFRQILLDKSAILFGMLAGAVSVIGVIIFYYVLEKGKASIIIPLTSLYPLISVIIAILFLKEKIITVNFLGMIFAIIAIILLSMK